MSSLAHKLPCMPSTAVRELLCTQTALHAQHQCAQPPWHQSMTSHVHTPLAHLPPGSMISLRPVCTSSCVHNLLAHPAPLCTACLAPVCDFPRAQTPCTPATRVQTSLRPVCTSSCVHNLLAHPAPLCMSSHAHKLPCTPSTSVHSLPGTSMQDLFYTASLHAPYWRAWPPMCTTLFAHPAPTRRASHVHRSPCTLSTNVHKRFTHPEPTHTTSHGR